MYIGDTHIHSHHSVDVPKESGATVDAICQAALDRGLSYVAITNHLEYLVAHCNPFPFDAVAEEVAYAKEKYKGRLYVANGVEFGDPFAVDEKKILETVAYPLDIILGSFHFVPGQYGYCDQPFHKMTWDECKAKLDEYFDYYYNALVKVPHMDVFTHPSYPTRYLLRAGHPVDITPWEEQIREGMRTIVQRGCGLEFNAASMRPPNVPAACDMEAYFARLFYEEGGEIITLASDAHSTAAVGQHLEKAAAILKEIGFSYTATYENRKPVFHKIDI